MHHLHRLPDEVDVPWQQILTRAAQYQAVETRRIAAQEAARKANSQ